MGRHIVRSDWQEGSMHPRKYLGVWSHYIPTARRARLDSPKTMHHPLITARCTLEQGFKDATRDTGAPCVHLQGRMVTKPLTNSLRTISARGLLEQI